MKKPGNTDRSRSCPEVSLPPDRAGLRAAPAAKAAMGQPEMQVKDLRDELNIGRPTL